MNLNCKCLEQTHLDFQSLQKSDALLRHIHVLFDEVVFDTAGLCCGKDSFPINAALSYCHRGLCFRVPVLEVHRDETPGVLHEILSGIEAISDRGHLELELD